MCMKHRVPCLQQASITFTVPPPNCVWHNCSGCAACCMQQHGGVQLQLFGMALTLVDGALLCTVDGCNTDADVGVA
jgi:hypothetical protein